MDTQGEGTLSGVDVYDRINNYVVSNHEAVSAAETDGVKSKDKWKKIWLFIKPRLPIFIIWVIWIIVGIKMAYQIFSIVTALIFLDATVLDQNMFNALFWNLLTFITWGISTIFDYWNYGNRKVATLTICFLNISIYAVQMFIALSFLIVPPLVFLIPVNLDITPTMLISLARLLSLIVAVIPSLAVTLALMKVVRNRDMRAEIVRFKINRHLDTRKHKKFLYDMNVVRNKDTGKFITVTENDRYLHTMADGTTGTAKTSGVFTPAIVNDLDQKIFNEDYLKKKFVKMIKRGELVLVDDIEDIDFSTEHFKPTQEGKKKFIKLISKVKNAGITTLAPNASFADTVYEFATARGIKVNRVDPMLEQGKHKPGFIGFNPLYISPKIKGIDRKIEIYSKATLFADVCQAIYELMGKGDPYFTSLNRNLTTSIVVMLELTMEKLEHRQPTPLDVQSVINDFSRAERYLKVLLTLPDRMDYQYIIDLVKNDLLGEGAAKINEQARGLRVQINELFAHPLIRDVLCCEDSSIDMDAALANGEITVVNYALELGQSQATAFGLFFALNFNNAVMRRPGNENTRIPHYYFIDELPVILHPRLEQIFTLFRQYRVCSHVALQSLDQLEKSEMTRYMKNVLLGNTAHQVFYGRMSPTEMRILEEMGGKYLTIMEQNTISQTALSDENTSKSFSTRTTATKDNFIEGADARYKDFMEVTFLTVSKGNAELPQAGKVEFVEKHRKHKVRRRRIDWHAFYDEGLAAEYREDKSVFEQVEVSHAIDSSMSEGSMSIMSLLDGAGAGSPAKKSEGAYVLENAQSLNNTDANPEKPDASVNEIEYDIDYDDSIRAVSEYEESMRYMNGEQ